MAGDYDLEIIEEYVLLGEKRFRVRVKGSQIVVNVTAGSREEALEKARMILERVGADKVLKKPGSRGSNS